MKQSPNNIGFALKGTTFLTPPCCASRSYTLPSRSFNSCSMSARAQENRCGCPRSGTTALDVLPLDSLGFTINGEVSEIVEPYFSFRQIPKFLSGFLTAGRRLFASFEFHNHLHHLRVDIRLLLLALPFFYFLILNPSRSLILDFLSACAFFVALLFSLSLALACLPSIRLVLSRSSRKAPLPMFWTIGYKPKSENKLNSGCWVQDYSNGDVYKGEFHKGKCSGSGVYLRGAKKKQVERKSCNIGTRSGHITMVSSTVQNSALLPGGVINRGRQPQY